MHYTEIPHEPMQINYTGTGFLPQVELHRRRRMYYQQSSYWHLLLSSLFPLAAIVIAFLPLETYTKWVWAGFCLFTGACGAVPFFLRDRFGQTITIDQEHQTVCIRKQGRETTIPWSDVVALQVCHQGKPCAGYQLNLIWRQPDGGLERHCLTNHVVRRFVLRLARGYASLLSLRIVDETTHSQPDGAANGSQPIRPERNSTSSAAGSRR
jgi:hypothetical protein